MVDIPKRWLHFTIRAICYVTVAVAIFCAGYRTGLRQSQMERDQLFTRVLTLTDRVHRSVHERQALHRVLSSEPDHLEPPLVALQTTWFDTLVQVSIGSDDGVRNGHQLIVERPHDSVSSNREVTVEVLETAPNSCICRPVVKSQAVPVNVNEA